jgi:short-subunit dehydrogenase
MMMRGSENIPGQTTALITGASGGIGYELAKVFARHGHDLVLVARSEEKLGELAEELRQAHDVDVKVIVKDLCAPSAAAELAAELRGTSIQTDILVNNAGVDVYGYFYATDWAKEYQMIQLNLVSLTELTKLLLGGMRDRGWGRILNLGSNGSFIPAPLNTVYAATKAYVWNFSIALAEELRGTGVTVTVLCPGVTRTGFQARANMEDVRLLRVGVLEAGAVAGFGYGAMMAGKSVAVPGLFTKLQFISARLLPASWMARIAKSMLEPWK